MSTDESPPPRLNLFALPNQTTIIFCGILAVIAAPLLVSLTSLRFMLTAPFLPLVVVLFAVWDFLVEPERERARNVARPLPPAARPLELHIAALSRAIGLAHPPVVLQSEKTLAPPFVFGTWRRTFLLLPTWAVSAFTHILENPGHSNTAHLDVVLRHELAHLVNRDVWLTRFSRSLLKMTVLTLLTYWFAQLWSPLIYMVLAQRSAEWTPLLPPSLLAQLPEQFLEIVRNPPLPNSTFAAVHWLEVSMMLLPIAGGALFLWVRDWHLLLRVRELYADARVDDWLGDRKIVEETWRWFALLPATSGSMNRPDEPLRWRWLRAARGWWAALQNPPPLSWPSVEELPKTLLPGPQPTRSQRRLVLKQPELVAGDAKAVGRRAGAIVLLIYVMNASLLSPLAQQGIGSAVTLGVGFIFLALGLTPLAVANMSDGRALRQQAWQAVVRFTLVFGLPLCAVILIDSAAAFFHPDWLHISLYAAAGYTPDSFTPLVDDPFSYMTQVLVGATALYLVAAPLFLFLFLRLDFWLKQRMLEWYSAAWVERHSAKVLLGVSLALGAFLFWGVSPVLELLAFPFILSPDAANLTPSALCWLLAGMIGVLFWRQDRQFHGRCGACTLRVHLPFFLGARCPHCAAELQPRLRKEDSS